MCVELTAAKVWEDMKRRPAHQQPAHLRTALSADAASEHDPKRVQLSRAKGWRMPDNTMKVDRTTKWGNPFIVGKHGTTAECVELFSMLANGYVCISKGVELARAQSDFLKAWSEHADELRGKNLACWCRVGNACHADVLLTLANRARLNFNSPTR